MKVYEALYFSNEGTRRFWGTSKTEAREKAFAAMRLDNPAVSWKPSTILCHEHDIKVGAEGICRWLNVHATKPCE